MDVRCVPDPPDEYPGERFAPDTRYDAEGLMFWL
jgi:hypothetical protein